MISVAIIVKTDSCALWIAERSQLGHQIWLVFFFFCKGACNIRHFLNHAPFSPVYFSLSLCKIMHRHCLHGWHKPMKWMKWNVLSHSQIIFESLTITRIPVLLSLSHRSSQQPHAASDLYMFVEIWSTELVSLINYL